MTDVHCHVSCGDSGVREFLIGRDFIGVHPWEAISTVPAAPSLRGEVTADPPAASPGEAAAKRSLEVLATQRGAAGTVLAVLRDRLLANPALGVGEIGLDRLKEREISQTMREVFEAQLKLALEFNRPVVLHGAKCWGQVVKAVREGVESRCRCRKEPDLHSTPTPHTYTFLFHGFSRSDGLIPDIVALGGYISVGPAVLNDHAVNYRELVRKIPLDRLLLETDRTAENAAKCPTVREIAAEVAELRGLSLAELESLIDQNAANFFPDP